MSFEVGSISARLGARFDDSDFDRFDRRYEQAERRARDKLEARLGADVDQRPFDRYQRSIRDVDRGHRDLVRGSGRVRSAFGSLFIGGAGVAAGAVGFGALAKGAMSAVSAFQESEKVARRQALVIRTMGQDAGASAEHVDKLASSLSKKVAIDDDTIKSGANVIRTFANIRNEAGAGNDVFDRTIKASLDLSAAFGTDLQSASIQLGKALNDPAKGAAALSRTGAIAKSDLEKLKDMAKAGTPVLEQQRFVLEAVEKQVKGTAAANATATGRMRVAFGELQETVGRALAPTFDRVAKSVGRFVTQMAEGRGAGGRFRDRMVAIARTMIDVGRGIVAFGRASIAELRRVIGFVRRNQTAFEVLAGAVAGLVVVRTITRLFAAFRTALAAATLAQMRLNLAMRANPIGIVVTVLAALAGALIVAYKRSDRFRAVVDEAFRRVKSAAGDAIAFILRRLDDFLGGLSTLASVMGKLPGPLGKPFRDAAGKIDNAREKIRQLADEADELGKKKIKPLTVQVNVALGPGGKQYRPGDGWGIDDAVRGAAKRHAGKMDISQIIGSMGLGGGAVGGTGLNAFNHLAPIFGVTVGSGIRRGAITSSGNRSYHAMGRARDFPGPPAAMMRFALHLAQKYGSRLKELIYTPLGFAIKNGRRVAPYAQADHYDHVHVAMRHGGKVGPTAGGASIRIAGEGSLDEWIVSQEGDRHANIGYAVEALQALTGRNIAFYRRGGKHKGKKRKPTPTLTSRDNRAIKRSVGRGEAGISTFERDIQQLEREYTQADRRFGISEEVLLIEREDGSTTVDQGALNTRLSELDALIRLRDQIKEKIEAYRRQVAKLVRALNDAIRKLNKALGAAKGRSRRKERAKYRDEIATYQDRIGELRNTHEDLGLDVVDQQIDLQELGAERAAVASTTGVAAPPVSPADPPDSPLAPEQQLPPSPAAIAAAALEQFTVFQASRAQLFSAHGQNFARAGTNPYAGETGLAAANRFYGAASRSGASVLEQGGGITQNMYLTIASERDAHMFTRVALHELQGAI